MHASPAELKAAKLAWPALGLAGLILLLVAERARPLRRSVESTAPRQARNLGLALVAGLTVSFLERPLMGPVTRFVEDHRIGLLQRLAMPGWARQLLGIVLLDYTLYLWHVLMHRVPVLWRMHQPHHTDRDLDASTALRFHAAELVASVPWRAAQALLIGVGPRTYRTWQTLTTAAILFHHSNLRLPATLERRLSLVVTTPRMHGIHHSSAPEEVNSNWSSGLSLWDHLHGTYRLDVPQSQIEIGVPAWRDPADLTFLSTIAMPFRRQRPSWLDEDGKVHGRERNNHLTLESTP